MPHLEELKRATDTDSDRLIRAALTAPSPETENRAWEAVSATACVMAHYVNYVYQANAELAELIPMLSPKDPIHFFLLVSYFRWMYEADEWKMVTPALQNDWSYFRRQLSRRTGDKPEFDPEMTARTSYFYCYPAPHFKSCVDIPAWKTEPGIYYCTASLNSLSELEKLEKYEEFCFYCLLFCIADHIFPNGAFCKRSPVNTKKCLQVLKTYNGQSPEHGWNSIKFLSLHLMDPDTPTDIRKLVGF
jgi:hypothetical protein